MSLPPQRLPQRHAQRRTLYHSRHKIPPLDLPNTGNPQALKSSAKKRQRFPVSNNNDSSAASDSNSDSDSKSDSGYSSNRNLDSKAEHYRKIRAEFVVAGPNLANPCDETKAIIKREEQMWKLYCKKIRKGDPVATLKIQRYIDKGILLDLRNIPTLGLDDSEVEKSALYVEDLCVLQNGLWVRD
ncbi:hypothetical protein DL98DRAFT_631753 [Cadophora sp. DSE1049]|nr:hypothetical protein DL98DRAFT_631753 [Cadophora sp. DSE1049]